MCIILFDAISPCLHIIAGLLTRRFKVNSYPALIIPSENPELLADRDRQCDSSPINMPLCASTGPVPGRCWQHRPGTGPVLATNGMFTGSFGRI